MYVWYHNLLTVTPSLLLIQEESFWVAVVLIGV